jgi:hypothetical protein
MSVTNFCVVAGSAVATPQTQASAAPAAGSPLASVRNGAGDPRVYYLDSSGDVEELGFYGSQWHVADISAAAGGT